RRDLTHRPILQLLRDELHQEGGTALEVKTQLDLVLRRVDHDEAQRREENGQDCSEDPLGPVEVSGEVPPEEDKQRESVEKRDTSIHGTRDLSVTLRPQRRSRGPHRRSPPCRRRSSHCQRSEG